MVHANSHLKVTKVKFDEERVGVQEDDREAAKASTWSPYGPP